MRQGAVAGVHTCGSGVALSYDDGGRSSDGGGDGGVGQSLS